MDARLQTNSVCSSGPAQTVGAWREQWRQLGLQAWSAESDGRRDMQNQRALGQEQVEDLRVVLRNGDEDFKAWEQQLWSGLSQVRKRVRALGPNLQFAPARGDVQRMVQGAKHDLGVFAEQARQQYDELAKLECTLQDTLEAALVRFEGWCSQESSLRRSRDTAKKASVVRPPSCSRARGSRESLDGSLAAEGKAVDKELEGMHEQLDKLVADIAEDGGTTGGWSNDDHDAFLRVLRKFKRRTGADFFAEIQQLLPNKSHEDLVVHVAWLTTYEERQRTKKQLVEKWRGIRAVSGVRSASAEPCRQRALSAAQEERREQASLRDRVRKEQIERRKLVEDWRCAREAEQRAQQEEQRQNQVQIQVREAQERRRQSESKRQAVAAFQERRAAEKSALRPATPGGACSPAAAGGPLSSEDKQRIAKRNAELLERKAAQVQQRRNSGQRGFGSDSQSSFDPPSRSRSSSASAAYQHVESRVQSHTQAYVEKSRDLREDMAAAAGPPSKYDVMPGNFAHQGVVRTVRACPSWRGQFGV